MLTALPHLASGKVRDIYAVGDDRLLMITSDRMSAFDVVMAEPIANKGRVLTAISAFWFDRISDIVEGHVISTDVADVPGMSSADAADGDLAGRIMLCRRAEMLPVECIVRGYITGSAWKEYRTSGTMHGAELPEGLLESARLPEAVFTPSTKAETGHDENISYDESAEILGESLAAKVRDVALAVYSHGAELAAERGIILADTKFEFGLIDGDLVLCDEVLTPDSSRFWPAESWEPGSTPPSFDKQPLRDYLETLDWDKTPPPPALPDEVVAATSSRYVDAYERITGLSFADWPGVS